MRTLSKTMFDRLYIQSEEAEKLGLIKTAENLTITLASINTRKDSELYSYAQEEAKSDVEKALWAAVIRASDYYGSTVDAANMQSVIEKMASDLMNEVRKDVGNTSGVGAYEPSVPGEHKENITLEIGE